MIIIMMHAWLIIRALYKLYLLSYYCLDEPVRGRPALISQLESKIKASLVIKRITIIEGHVIHQRQT